MRGAPLPPDHAPHVAGRHRQLHQRLAARVALGDADRVRLVGQRLRDRLDDRPCAAHDAEASAGDRVSRGAGGIRSTSVRTVSDGCAPSFSQCASRSRSSFSVSGLVRGL